MMYTYGEMPSQNRIPSPIYEDVDDAVAAANNLGMYTLPNQQSIHSGQVPALGKTYSGTSEKSFEDNVFKTSPDGKSVRMVSVRRANPAYVGTNSTDGIQTITSAASTSNRRRSNPGPLLTTTTIGPPGLDESTSVGGGSSTRTRGSESSGSVDGTHANVRDAGDSSAGAGAGAINSLARKVTQWDAGAVSQHVVGRPPASLPQTPNSAFGVEPGTTGVSMFESSYSDISEAGATYADDQIIQEVVYEGAGVIETSVDAAGDLKTPV